MLDNGINPTLKEDSNLTTEVDLILGNTAKSGSDLITHNYAIVRKVDEYTTGIVKL